MDSPCDTACAVGCPIRRSEDHRALAPPLGFSQRATSFIASRCQGIHQMPLSCRARAQPQARACACWAEIRGQMAEDRYVRDAVLFSVLCDLLSGTRTPPLPMLAHRQHIPMPRPDLTPGHPPTMMAGPASRSRLASRFPKNTGQRSHAGPHDPPRILRRNSWSKPQKTCLERLRCSLCSVP